MKICPVLSLLIASLAVSLTQASASPSAQGDQSLCSVAMVSFGEAERIRGLRRKRSVPCLVQNKDEVRAHLESMVASKLPAKKLKIEEALYRGIGLIPEDYDYTKGILDLYVSQLGGYYDPEKAHFVMAGWLPGLFQGVIAVHELTHALQDQYFNLGKLIDPKHDNGDELLARSALAEGDATAVMIDYTRDQTGQPRLAKDPDVEGAMLQNVVSMGMGSGLEDVPKSLKNMLLFPYTSGLRFAHSILRKGGYKAIDKAFVAPPKTTEEILHPEKFGNRAEWRPISDRDVHAAAHYGDTIGEFGIVALMSAHFDDAVRCSSIAAGWAGDRAVLVPQSDGKRIMWRTMWDTEADAKEFKDALTELIDRGKLKGGSVTIAEKTVEFTR